MAKTVQEPTTKTLVLIKTDGEYRLTIPGDAQLTFGPAIPQARGTDKMGYQTDPKREYALRVYQGNKTNIIAVFTGVCEFRVENLFSMKKKIASEAGSTIWKDDENGYKIETNVKKKQKLIDVDKDLEF